MSTEIRSTKYSQAVVQYLADHGHATNNELVFSLRKQWPDVSATTIHRVTARLAEQHIIAHAPKNEDGFLRYDANTTPHHHFYCGCCNVLRDIQLDNDIVKQIENTLGGCKLSGQLLITGSCGRCSIKSNNHKHEGEM